MDTPEWLCLQILDFSVFKYHLNDRSKECQLLLLSGWVKCYFKTNIKILLLENSWE